MDVAGMFLQRRRKSRGDYLIVAQQLHNTNSEHAGLLLSIARFGSRFWDPQKGLHLQDLREAG